MKTAEFNAILKHVKDGLSITRALYHCGYRFEGGWDRHNLLNTMTDQQYLELQMQRKAFAHKNEMELTNRNPYQNDPITFATAQKQQS